MSQSCDHDLPCNCLRDASEVIHKIKDQIERCNQKNMNLEETMANLQYTYQIDPYITKTIWEQLDKENPVFLKAYHWRCEKWRQKKICNGLLAEQVALMHDHVHLDLTNPPPEIVNILCQHPELGTRLLQNLAITPRVADRSEVSPQSLSLSDTNSPIVNQLQNPNDQCSTPDYFACKEPESVRVHAQGKPLYRIPESEASNNANFDSRVPAVAQAATTAQDSSTPQIRDHIRDNSLRELQTLQLGGSNNRIHFRELYNRLQNGETGNGIRNGGSNNGLQNGESSNGILNGGITNRMLNGERINGIQIGGRTNALLNEGSNNELENRGNICGISTRLQNGESITRIHYRRRINGQQDWENINRVLNGGRINELQGVIPQQNHHFQEQDNITVQDQGEPSYSTSDSETSNNSDSESASSLTRSSSHNDQYTKRPKPNIRSV